MRAGTVALLDTNACIALLKNDAAFVKRVRAARAADFRLCSVVKAELVFGAYKSARRSENLRAVRALFEEMTSLPFDDEAAEHYGRVRNILNAAGTPIGPNDLLIASIALANDLAVMTRNVGEFERVAGLTIETW